MGLDGTMTSHIELVCDSFDMVCQSAISHSNGYHMHILVHVQFFGNNVPQNDHHLEVVNHGDSHHYLKMQQRQTVHC